MRRGPQGETRGSPARSRGCRLGDTQPRSGTADGARGPRYTIRTLATTPSRPARPILVPHPGHPPPTPTTSRPPRDARPLELAETGTRPPYMPGAPRYQSTRLSRRGLEAASVAQRYLTLLVPRPPVTSLHSRTTHGTTAFLTKSFRMRFDIRFANARKEFLEENKSQSLQSTSKPKAERNISVNGSVRNGSASNGV